MIENAIYKILKEITKDKTDGVYLDFVNDSTIDKNKTYIVYSLITSTPHYDFEYGRNVYQIAVYSNDLSKALNIQREIGKHFNSLNAIIDNTEICGCDISNETHNYVEDFYQAISMINILYKY
ncbi:hypothetical protein [Brachyspira pilosicoli]|uniref:hypothetical protein n=1 Tax=Brachyspira pilosicoli TaxID=52584 RepID=UPI000E11AC04|nr:hypothetical protein [Brachyspira pilosicoli]SUW04304.1 Uncharacterised protein [Brachyspira pilosicoli]SUW07969.1 Uncharacterised protein [Brachyspira pilosicoli]